MVNGMINVQIDRDGAVAYIKTIGSEEAIFEY